MWSTIALVIRNKSAVSFCCQIEQCSMMVAFNPSEFISRKCTVVIVSCSWTLFITSMYLLISASKDAAVGFNFSYLIYENGIILYKIKKKMLKMYEANILCIKMKNRISNVDYLCFLFTFWSLKRQREREIIKRLLNKFYSCNNYLYQIT